MAIKGHLLKRAIDVGNFIIESHQTIRHTAEVLGMSKGAVHHDIQVTLKTQDPSLYNQVQQVLDENNAQKHIRGGQATKAKYLGQGAGIL